MPTITVKSGPYKGWIGDSLLDLLDHQAETMANCPHDHQETEKGTAGSGLSRYHWQRQRCLDCGDCVSNEPTVFDPDFAKQRLMDTAFWGLVNKELQIRSKLYVIERKAQGYGWTPAIFYDEIQASNCQNALERYLGTNNRHPRNDYRVTEYAGKGESRC